MKEPVDLDFSFALICVFNAMKILLEDELTRGAGTFKVQLYPEFDHTQISLGTRGTYFHPCLPEEFFEPFGFDVETITFG